MCTASRIFPLHGNVNNLINSLKIIICIKSGQFLNNIIENRITYKHAVYALCIGILIRVFFYRLFVLLKFSQYGTDLMRLSMWDVGPIHNLLKFNSSPFYLNFRCLDYSIYKQHRTTASSGMFVAECLCCSFKPLRRHICNISL